MTARLARGKREIVLNKKEVQTIIRALKTSDFFFRQDSFIPEPLKKFAARKRKEIREVLRKFEEVPT